MKSAIALGVAAGLALCIAMHDKNGPDGAGAQARPKLHAALLLPRGTSTSAVASAPATAPVIAPFFGNEKCPIDGRPTQRDRAVEFDGQRIYGCSDACVDAIKIDSANLYKKAYPQAQRLALDGCAVCGAPVDRKQPVETRFQGRLLGLCTSSCLTEFRKIPILVLMRLAHPDAQEVRNDKCPIEGERIDGVTYVVYKASVVGLSAPACVARFEKDPETALAKAKAKARE